MEQPSNHVIGKLLLKGLECYKDQWLSVYQAYGASAPAPSSPLIGEQDKGAKGATSHRGRGLRSWLWSWESAP